MLSLQYRLCFFTGLLCTMSYLGFPKGTEEILASYNISLILLLLVFIYNSQGCIRIKRNLWPAYLLFILFVVSLLLNIFYLNDIWFSSSLNSVIKFTGVFGVLMLFLYDKNFRLSRENFFRGFCLGAYIQLCWSFGQILFWFVGGLSLNEIVFGSLGLPAIGGWTHLTDTDVSIFRMTGIGWEGANLVLCFVIGFILTDSPLGKILLGAGIILSTSRAGIITFLSAITFQYLYTKYIYGINFKIQKKFILSVVGVLVVSTVILTTNFLDNFIFIFNGILDIFAAQQNFSTGRHMDYYLEFDTIWNGLTLTQNLFGCGTFVAGLPYSDLLGYYTEISTWSPESDIITLLVGNGVIGLMLYWFWLFKIFFSSSNIKVKTIVISIFVSGILYLNIRSWVFLLLIFLYNEKKLNCNNQLN